MGFKLKLDVYEGPLDLLLYLIRKEDVDVINIPIAKITEQYLQFIDVMKLLDLDFVGDFLVMAATLMHIKSRMLLPPENPDEEQMEEDPKDALIRRLTEYQHFKEIAGDLQGKEQARKDLFPRPPDEEQKKKWKDEAREVYIETNLFDLISAFSDALQRIPEDVIHEIIKEHFTVEQKIHELLHLLLDRESVLINEVFQRCRNKEEAIVTFLALLELIRLQEIKAFQKRAFAEIEICRNKENIMPVEHQENETENLDIDKNE